MKYGVAVRGSHGKTTTTSMSRGGVEHGGFGPDDGDRWPGGNMLGTNAKNWPRASFRSPRPMKATAVFLLLVADHRGGH
jgi:hypothetical protein